MKRTTIFWLVLVGIVSVGVMTQAEPDDPGRLDPPPRDSDDRRPPPPPKPPIEHALDADRDGEISAAEIAAAPAALRKLDKNGDGKLTPEEYRPRRPRRGMGSPEGEASPGERRRPRPADGGQGPRKSDGDGQRQSADQDSGPPRAAAPEAD